MKQPSYSKEDHMATDQVNPPVPPTGKETMKRVQVVESRIARKEPVVDVAPVADKKA